MPRAAKAPKRGKAAAARKKAGEDAEAKAADAEDCGAIEVEDGLAELASGLNGTGTLADEEFAAVQAMERDLAKGPKSRLRQDLESKPLADVATVFTTVLLRLQSLPAYDKAAHRRECALLGTVAALASSWLQSTQEQAKGSERPLPLTPAGLLGCVKHLHGLLFVLGDAKDVQRKICRACELWWALELDGKEQLVTRALPIALIFSLDEEAKKVDVKRVFAMRRMLDVIDLEDDSSVALKHLLLRCFLSPLFLHTEEGVKFLAELCWLSEEFVAEIHATIKGQLPFAARAEGEEAMIEHYADVYFRAWRGAAQASPEILARIEVDMVQDLMDAAVHVADPTLSLALFKLLNRAFHDNKNARDVDAMLLRLYNPILWRALSVANPLVRENATRLLARAFPLQDPEAPVAEIDQVLQRQFTAIETLLHDSCPQVRVAAVQGACRMLSVYWELIPNKATVSLISVLVGDLLHDASSPRVRVAVLKGLEFISQNPLSQAALKDVLPHVSNFIHDNSRLVRNALVGLLVRVKSIRSIKFYEVVPVEHLLERLASDPHLASKLTLLLLESFFPQGVSGSEQLSRAVALIQSHPRAATRFMANIHKHLSTGPVCKLAMLLGKWVLNQVSKDALSSNGAKGPKTKRTKSKGVAKQASDDGAGTAAEEASVDRECEDFVFLGAMQSIAALWASVAGSLATARYATARKQMNEAFSFDSFIRPILSAERVQTKLGVPPLLEIAAQLPCDEDFKADVLAGVLRLECSLSLETREVAQDVAEEELKRLARVAGPAIDCLCLWSSENVVLEAIQSALESTLGPPAKRPKKKAVGKKGRAVARGGSEMDPFVAIWCLQYLFANNPNGARDTVLRSGPRSLASIEELLGDMTETPFAVETLAKIAIHRAVYEKEHVASQSARVLVDEEGEDEPGSEEPERCSPLPPSLSKLLDASKHLKPTCDGPGEADAEKKPKRKAKSAATVASLGSENQALVAGTVAGVMLVAVNDCAALGMCGPALDASALQACQDIAGALPASMEKVGAKFLQRFSDRAPQVGPAVAV